MKKEKLHSKIMLVDDDPVVNFINTKLITSRYDCEIGAYTEAIVALEHLKTPATAHEVILPGLLLLDINMPVMNGWSFLMELEKLPAMDTRKCKVYMLSSSVDLDDENKSKQFNSVHGFISKPLTIDKFRELVSGI